MRVWSFNFVKTRANCSAEGEGETPALHQREISVIIGEASDGIKVRFRTEEKNGVVDGAAEVDVGGGKPSNFSGILCGWISSTGD